MLDLSCIHAPYQNGTRGTPPFDPAVRTCPLRDSYCVGIFSSRKIAQTRERNLASPFFRIVDGRKHDPPSLRVGGQ
jgi:hypothetical protein